MNKCYSQTIYIDVEIVFLYADLEKNLHEDSKRNGGINSRKLCKKYYIGATKVYISTRSGRTSLIQII